MNAAKITSEHLGRGALVYVRQSSAFQVRENLESQRRQYGLEERARELGFLSVAVVDEDLGRSGSGSVERPGFQSVVSAVCDGKVGAVFCIEASRLARNGREWHLLLDVCGLVGALIIDPEGVYDPRLSNDRLLLGLKGTMSEFELTLMRQRSFEAIHAKARRGELRFTLPVGLCWTEDDKIELNPDRRVQDAIQLVFRKFTELGSARQVLMLLRDQQIKLPVRGGERRTQVLWTLPVYHQVLSTLQNAMYAGAYVFGMTEARTRVVDGRAHKSAGHPRPRDQWVLIRDHHPGYITWTEFEHNQVVLGSNARMKQTIQPKSGRGGLNLLTGLLRCARCGHILQSAYRVNGIRRYECRYLIRKHGAARCIGFSAKAVDAAVISEIMRVVQPKAIDIAVAAMKAAGAVQGDTRRALELELEQALYEARLASRRYESVDPDNRLVASELEARWNGSLARVQELQGRVDALSSPPPTGPSVSNARLHELAADLAVVWEAPTSDPRVKQRIAGLLIQEIVADIDAENVNLFIHWQGGRHTPLKLPRRKSGHHDHSTKAEALDVMRRMSATWPDAEIARTLNRLGLKTGVGNTWTESRVYSARKLHGMLDHDPRITANTVTMKQAAKRLGVGIRVMERLVASKVVEGTQAVPAAPWLIDAAQLNSEAVKNAVRRSLARGSSSRTVSQDDQTLVIPGT